MNFALPRIYPITDVAVSGISHAEQVERLIAGGAEFIQLREKRATSKDFYESASRALQIVKDSGVRIIINDRVDIALALNADGVHLGQVDIPPEKAREILGDDAIIGLSTHSIEQARRALGQPVDYIAIGPIFQTQTKGNADAPIGLGGISNVREMIGDFPLVAIGGINAENLRSVFDSGADSAAMIGAVVSNSKAIEDRMRHFISLAAR